MFNDCNKCKSIIVGIIGFVATWVIFIAVNLLVIFGLFAISKIPLLSSVLGYLINQGMWVEFLAPFVGLITANAIVEKAFHSVFSNDSSSTESLSHILLGILLLISGGIFLLTNLVYWNGIPALASNMAIIFLGVAFIKES